MSIARITMMEYLSEKDVVASENFYQTIQKDWFGNEQAIINVPTGPTSLLSLAVYSSYADAESNLPKRKEFQEIVKIHNCHIIEIQILAIQILATL